MSVFAATVESIGQVWEHPNADRMEIASIDGLDFRFCVGKGQYKAGDRVIYIPIDAILPDDLIKRLGVGNFLAGAQKNRVKTAQLRGQISQGLVCRVDTIFGDNSDSIPLKTDVAPLLGITKYEPPEVFVTGGKLAPLPDGLGVYDIEGAERFAHIVELLMDRPCYITEKVEGTNAALVKLVDGTFAVCQRNYAIKSIGDSDNPNTYERGFRNGGLDTALDWLSCKFPNEQIALRGELLGPGIQGNIYKLDCHAIRLFDIKVGRKYLSAQEFIDSAPNPDVRVPIIAVGVTLREWLAGRSIQDASNGISLLNQETRREGIVIKPMIEDCVDFGGGRYQRLIIKQRSPLYLANEKA